MTMPYFSARTKNIEKDRGTYTRAIELISLNLQRLSLLAALICLWAIILTARAAAGQSPIREMSNTVESLCPVLVGVSDSLSAAERDVLFRCGEFKIRTQDGQTFGDLNEAQLNGLSQMTGDELSTTKNMNVDLAGSQYSAITARLQALRKGGGGGLAVNVRDNAVEPILLAGPISALTPSQPEPAAPFDFGKWGFFVTGSFGAGEKERSEAIPGFDYAATDLSTGIDYRFSERFVSGLAIGYSTASADMNADAGDLDASGLAASLYGGYTYDRFYLNGIFTVGWKYYESARRLYYVVDRNPNDPAVDAEPETTVDQTFEGDTDAAEYLISLGGGYDFDFGSVTMGPYGGVNYFYTSIEGFSESLSYENRNDGFGLALAYDDQSIESLTSVIGAQGSTALSTPIGVILPYLRIDYAHEFVDRQDDIKARFVNGGTFDEAVANNRIIIPAEDPDADFFNFGIGTSAVFPYGISAFADYSTILGLRDISYYQVTGGFRIEI